MGSGGVGVGAIRTKLRDVPVAFVAHKSSNNVAAAACGGFAMDLDIGVTSLADRRCGSLAAKQEKLQSVCRLGRN